MTDVEFVQTRLHVHRTSTAAKTENRMEKATKLIAEGTVKLIALICYDPQKLWNI